MKRISLFIVTTIVLSGCYDPHAQGSKIVREAEANGSGNLNTFTLPGLANWFSHRPQLATKIDGECRPLWTSGDANWVTTAEGTVCQAARAAVPPPPVTADQRIW